MSKFQRSYDQANLNVKRIEVPEIQDEINQLEKTKRTVNNPDARKAIDAKIKALKIKITSIKRGDPVQDRMGESNLSEAKKGLDATKAKWISKIGGDKEAVTKFVHDKVVELEKRYGNNYAAIVGTLKKILSRKYDVSLDEEAQAAVTTGSIGSPTMSTGDGGTAPAIFGNSSIFAKSMGTISRVGSFPAVNFKKKKKKKTQKEFVEFYFENGI